MSKKVIGSMREDAIYGMGSRDMAFYEKLSEKVIVLELRVSKN